ncbi:hypothetical protein [Lelliottia aquatilis]|uniref:hypothetical protein n=1 Tax=Lelliottia aquatilis TaxID=2080838 RepID=UPI001575247B|nr:hypothetical protein [Lelliottia aquatilis]
MAVVLQEKLREFAADNDKQNLIWLGENGMKCSGDGMKCLESGMNDLAGKRETHFVSNCYRYKLGHYCI